MTVSIAGLFLYLWVIHSAKAPLATTGLIIGFLGVLVGRERFCVPPGFSWYTGFVVWALIGYSSASFPDESWERLLLYGKLWLVFLLAANVAHSQKQFRLVVLGWLAIFAAYPVRGTLYNIVFGYSTFGRYAWNFIFYNPNDLASLTLPLLALTIAVLQRDRTGWTRWAALIGVAILPLIILATQSRGGILALLTMGLLLFAPYWRRGKVVILVLVVVGTSAVLAPSGVWNRLSGLRNVTHTESLQTVDTEGSADQRFEIWKVAWTIAREHPMLGIGVGAYPLVHEQYAQRDDFKPTARGRRDTHSMYLNLLAETGIPGFLLFMGMLASILFASWKSIRVLRDTRPEAAMQIRTLAIGLLAFLQASVFATLQHVAFMYVYIGLLAALIRIETCTAVRPFHGTIRGRRRPPMISRREGVV